MRFESACGLLILAALMFEQWWVVLTVLILFYAQYLDERAQVQ